MNFEWISDFKKLYKIYREGWKIWTCVDKVWHHEILIFLGMIMILWYVGKGPYSKNVHAEVFRGEISFWGKLQCNKKFLYIFTFY